MDRYAKFSDYFNEKLKIFSNQDGDDTLILNYDAKELRGLEGNARSRILFYSRLKNAKGAYLKDQKVYCLSGGEEKEICAVTDIPLKGLHNVENVLASVLAAAAAGVEPGPMKDVIKKFKGLSHRFETIAIIDGVDYIDDSKGTTVDSTYRALESCAKPVVLIAGGKDKHSDYSAVKDIVKRKVKELVLIGEASGAIRKAIGGAVATHQAKDMFDAVRLARGLAQKDDIVLLSPMCSSFDMFSSYKERGEVFKKAVGCIKGSCQKVKI
jgi:UDP-N-acetylmuramoylalanine--D-glutamate ligase